MRAKKLYGVIIWLNLMITLWLCFHLFSKQNVLPDFSNHILKVSGLVVTDSLGVERVIIGGAIPPATFNGFRNYRGSDEGIAGVMLYDAEGQERGGYVTDDGYGNVYLTLDSKTQQNALFIADPLGGGAIQVWGKNGNKISFSAGDDNIYIDLLKKGEPVEFEAHEK